MLQHDRKKQALALLHWLDRQILPRRRHHSAPAAVPHRDARGNRAPVCRALHEQASVRNYTLWGRAHPCRHTQRGMPQTLSRGIPRLTGCARTIYRYAHIIYYTSQATHPAQGQGTAAALSRARGQNRVFSLILPICHTQRTASLSSRMRISASLPRVSAPLRSCTPMMWAGVSLAMRMASSRGTSA